MRLKEALIPLATLPQSRIKLTSSELSVNLYAENRWGRAEDFE